MRSPALVIGLLSSLASAVQRFRSTPLLAADISSNKTGATVPGYLWIEPGQGGSNAGGAQIIADDGSLVWRDTTGADGTNFNLQPFNGKQYLTFWRGDKSPQNGCGYGSVDFLDSTYTQRYSVCVTDPNIVRFPGTPDTQTCQIDYHESRVTDRGTLLGTGRQIVQRDLRYLGGPQAGYILDSIFYEVDIATNNVLFRWSPLDHLDQYDSLAASQFRLPDGNNATTLKNAWDYWHSNSVARVPAPMGGFILSSRPLSSIFKLDEAGNIEWVIGGRTGGNFTVAAGAKFRYQHDVVPISATATTLTLSLFNNNNCDRRPNLGPSSGLVITVDTAAMTVKRKIIFQAPPPTPMSQHGGGTQNLPNNGAVVSYGGTNFIQEYDPTGKVVNALQISGGSSFRVYKYEFVGRPARKPDVASIYDADTDTTDVYMSWNGGTDIGSWVVGDSSAPKTSFETHISLHGFVPTVQASALGFRGTTLATSAVVTTSGGPSART